MPVDDWIDIAVFGEGEHGAGSVLFLDRRCVRTSHAAFEILVDRRPDSVTIDPYYKLIDRGHADNGRAVLSAALQPGR